MEDVSKIRAALEILRVPNPSGTDKRSWMRGQLHRQYQGAERHCILGALEHVGASTDNRQAAYGLNNGDTKAILRVANEQFPREGEYGWSHIPSFNDSPERTFDDIELVLEKAAVAREEEGATSDWTLS